MLFDLLHPADQIVMIMERIYGYGMTTTSGGNLSIREENGEIWITPGGTDKGALTREDIVHVMPDGRVLGCHRPSVELPFHQMIYERRPDLRAVIHAHPPALIAFSIVRKVPDTSLVPNMRLVCGAVGLARYGLPGSLDLGQKIASVFAEGSNAAILENHGVVVGGKDLFKAFMAFETLDYCARLEIDARRVGTPRGLSPRDIELSDHKQHLRMDEFVPRAYSSKEREARRDMCELIRRACDQKLFTSTQGTFSQRLSQRDFVITPYMVDRKYIEADDLVRIEDGRREAGKTPSRSVLLHHHIYAEHPHVGSIIVAHPPHIMAFAVTDQIFDTRTIPESYIVLRKVARLPYGSTFMEPDQTAALFTADTPLALVQNDCAVVTGQTLIQAFDRLEVAEYGAKALIACRELGEVVMIEAERVADIDKAFKL
ncbi:MAG TPA: class II aldolase/adducin family protein [Anaeromyxobacteraceae bacterium]|nr:class II aldolase/adducin family protein [Anaeromyxobacteraceae bacterium]